MSTDEYEDLAKALEKLALNDPAIIYEKDSSAALGFGFRCGFLGLLHLDVVQERLQREYGLSLLLSAPSVRYRVTLESGEQLMVDNPSVYPDPAKIAKTEEPYIKASIMMPERYLGPIMELCRERRGEHSTFHYLAQGRVELTSELPLAEVLFDFYDRLKTLTQGYGSFDYDLLDYRETKIAKVDILVNGEPQATVPDRHPGGDRRQDHRPHHHQPLPEGRHREMLRGRHHPQAKAPREAEGRQEADEDGGVGGDSPGRLRRRPQVG
jgi:GTP-binding protein LepA